MPNKVAMRPDVPHKLLAKLIEAMKAKGVRRGKERDFVRLAERHLSEVRRSVSIATAFAFLCWAWHVRCHMHGSVLEHCFRLSSQNRKELHIRNPQKNPSKIGSLIDISRSREQNCCVLLGSQTLGAEFYS